MLRDSRPADGQAAGELDDGARAIREPLEDLAPGAIAERAPLLGLAFGEQFEAFPGPFEYHMTRTSEQTGGAITNMEPGK